MAFVIFQVFCVKAVLEKWLAACIDSVPAEMRDSVHPKEGFEPRGEYYTFLVVCYCWFSWLPVLIDSSVSERFSGLFFIVWNFSPRSLPPHPNSTMMKRDAQIFCFSLCHALTFLEWPFHTLISRSSCSFCQARWFFSCMYFVSLTQKSLSSLRRFSGWQVSQQG